ncbi:hypothetical protein GUJ93_ZPchr0011g28112 [Zizania palustris]|uniref:Uncharacterized protein n=1 Tax=Zizania palustris TaxID=103762 RepID=A0A8J6BPF8_ZIZPA|nr:hypothetical protein GUJ93_ZPchr0011g28112 [Zizania palustris]
MVSQYLRSSKGLVGSDLVTEMSCYCCVDLTAATEATLHPAENLSPLPFIPTRAHSQRSYSAPPPSALARSAADLRRGPPSPRAPPPPSAPARSAVALRPPLATVPSAASGLPSHMFEAGAYSFGSRVTTLVSKGATFSAVGFAAGLAGTALSNGLMTLRKRMDPAFETPNKPPPTLLNAATWAIHMGIISNLRYQMLNGVEYLLTKAVSPSVFKVSVVALRCMNNVLDGMSFVLLARLTGSQKSDSPATSAVVNEKERLIA